MGLFDKIKSTVNEAVGSTPLSNLTNSTTHTNRSVLDTPPPPAVPQSQQTMSVMIAVNGQTYGPYERASLLKMIADGSLTPETYVFINGMTEWKPATQVPSVAVLFNQGNSLPPVPPIPWNGNNNSGTQQEQDSPFSPRLNKLITAAVADGEISDLERQVLIRSAQEEGVAMDEFVMILEARLFERRQVLAERNKSNMQAQPPLPTPNAAQKSSRPQMEKCPACGAPIKALATACPECGYEYSAGIHGECSAWERLNEELRAIDNEKSKGLVGKYLSLMGASASDPEKLNRKKNLIQNFAIPSDKRGIFDFFVSCATICGSSNIFNRDELHGAYKVKAKQVLLKARVIMKDDPKMLSELNEIAKQYNIKA